MTDRLETIRQHVLYPVKGAAFIGVEDIRYLLDVIEKKDKQLTIADNKLTEITTNQESEWCFWVAQQALKQIEELNGKA